MLQLPNCLSQIDLTKKKSIKMNNLIKKWVHNSNVNYYNSISTIMIIITKIDVIALMTDHF